MSPPLLRAVDPQLRAVDPRRSRSDLVLGSFEARGPLLTLVGDWRPVFELWSGSCQLAGGRLELLGAPAEGALLRGELGLLVHGAPLPPTWSTLDVLVASAELSGSSRRAATRQAREVLERLGLEPIASKRMSRLRPAEQRAVGIAVAALGDPPVLALEQPFDGLEPSAQAFVAEVLSRALPGRAALVSVAELPGSASEDALAAQSSELLCISGRRLVARGSYRELGARARSYRVIVKRSVAGLLSALTEAGYEAEPMSSAEATTLRVTDVTGKGTLPLFGAALAADAPIIELVALGFGEPLAPPDRSGLPRETAAAAASASKEAEEQWNLVAKP